MGEEFQAGVCNSTWWNSARSCSLQGYNWPSTHDHDLVVEMKQQARSSDESGGSVSDQQPDSGGSVWMDSTLQMMGINGISSPPSSSTTTDWNQALFGRKERNYNSSVQQEDMNSRLNFHQETGMDQWNSTTIKNFSVGGQDSTTNGFNQTNNIQGFSSIDQASQGYPSILLQTLFSDEDPQQQPSPFDNRSTMNEFSPLPKLPPLLRPSVPEQPPFSTPLNLTNTAPLWSASSASLTDTRGSLFPSIQTQFLASTFEDKPSCTNFIAKGNNEAVQDHSCSVGKKGSEEPLFKRPRIETPSPLPTFKVRKEKLGDRITALQQLVSPFGKTDTASVLQEAIEYIKFLHDQVNVLSTPYMKNGAPIPHQQTSDKLKNTEGKKQDLSSRGLCLVPMSSTYPVTNETTVDFWTPTFGGTFR